MSASARDVLKSWWCASKGGNICSKVHLAECGACSVCADDILSTLSAAGFVIVPREPTEAPETLAALKEVTEILVDWLPRLRGLRADEATARAFVSDRIAMAKAAIAKAEGKQ